MHAPFQENHFDGRWCRCCTQLEECWSKLWGLKFYGFLLSLNRMMRIIMTTIWKLSWMFFHWKKKGIFLVSNLIFTFVFLLMSANIWICIWWPFTVQKSCWTQRLVLYWWQGCRFKRCKGVLNHFHLLPSIGFKLQVHYLVKIIVCVNHRLLKLLYQRHPLILQLHATGLPLKVCNLLFRKMLL